MFPGSLKGVSRKFQGRFKEVSRKIQGRFKSVSRKFQENIKGVSRKFHVCFNYDGQVFQEVLSGFQGYLKED